jgi:hypothetical protein
MKGQNTYPRNPKLAAGVAIAGFALATLFCKLDGAVAQAWNPLDGSALVAIEVVRAVIVAGWQLVPAYLCEDARCLQDLAQIVACGWQLLFVIAG